MHLLSDIFNETQGKMFMTARSVAV